MLFSPFRRRSPLPGFVLSLIGLVACSVTLPGLSAKQVSIADTGYLLEVPGNFNVHRPAGAPDILLQADRPDGNGTIQVVRRPGQGSASDFVAGYEAQMQQALGNLNLQQENMRTVAGRSCTFRRYQSFADGMQIRVQALFYADGNQGFIIHAIDTAAGAPEFERAVLSLQAPGNTAPPQVAQTGWGPSAPSSAASPAGRQAIGQTAYTFVPPTGWQSTQPSQTPGLGFALPDKGAAMELTWLDVSGQVGDRATFLDETVAQIESGFGEGWHERERSPHRNGNTNVLFTRFGGQLGNQAAELMILGVTDGQSLVLAYGYFAELGRDSAGPAMREAILSIKGGSASAPATPVATTANPSSSGGWGSPPAATYSSSSASASGSGGWGAPPAATSSASSSGSGWGSPSTPTNTTATSSGGGWGSPPATSSSSNSGWGAPPAATSTPAPSADYETVVIDDAGYEFSKPKTFRIAQRSEGQTQWADPNISGAKVVMVLQTMFRNAGNTVDSVRDDLVGQVNNSSAANMVGQRSGTINGMKTHQLHFTLNRGAEPQHFRFVVLDLPNDYVGTISFTAPESQNLAAEQHFNEVLRTVRVIGASTVASPPPAPNSRQQLSTAPARSLGGPSGQSSGGSNSGSRQQLSTASGSSNSGADYRRKEPDTAKDTYYALAQAVGAQDWEWVASHLTDESLLSYCRSFRNSVPDADYTEADARDNPSGTFRAYMGWKQPRADLERLFETTRTISGQREENPDLVLVMTKRTSGGENYLWFKRIKGRWMCDVR